MGDSSMYNRPQGWAPTEKSSSERGSDCPILLYLVEIMENKKKLTCSAYEFCKNEIAHNCDFTMSNLILQLEKAFSKVTAQTCFGIIKKVREVEDAFWRDDAALGDLY